MFVCVAYRVLCWSTALVGWVALLLCLPAGPWLWAGLLGSAWVGRTLLTPGSIRWMPRRVSGKAWSYGGLQWSRNDAARGTFITGRTGSGKSEIVLNHLYHSLCVHEDGRERASWAGSEAARFYQETQAAFRRRSAQVLRSQDEADAALQRADERLRAVLGATLPRMLASEAGPGAFGGRDLVDIAQRLADQNPGIRVALDERIAAESGRAACEHALVTRQRQLRDLLRPLERLRYESPPWGGLIAGEKGDEWQFAYRLFHHHGREQHLQLLQTRPRRRAGSDWSPPATLNLIGDETIPPATLAKYVCDTALTEAGGKPPDTFFDTKARLAIAQLIALLRETGRAQGERTPFFVPERRTPATLARIHKLATDRTAFEAWAAQSGHLVPGQDGGSGVHRGSPLRGSLAGGLFQEFWRGHWGQPADQLGGVTGTIDTYLGYFIEPTVAEVFSPEESTFAFSEIEQGTVVVLALPQSLAVHRRVITTLLCHFHYHVIRSRFDLRKDDPRWVHRNFLPAFKDEWQSFAIPEDGALDKTRAAGGTTLAAAQTHLAVYDRLGGKEKAAPILANLATRFICTAAADECAEESAKFIGKHPQAEKSKSYGRGGTSTSFAIKDQFLLPPHRLRALSDFTVAVVPAGHLRWLYRVYLVSPVDADGRIPEWWFGTWNPMRWMIRGLAGSRWLADRLPALRQWCAARCERPPAWRCRAPFRVYWRKWTGRDPVFIPLEGRKVAARRSSSAW